MAIPASKQELLRALTDECGKLMTELESIPPQLTREPTLQSGISVSDVVAYQIGWASLLAGWYNTGKKGKMPELPAPGFKWNQLGDLAKHFYAEDSDHSYKDLLALFRMKVKAIEKIIDENTNEQLYTHDVYNWTGIWPLGRWINVNTSSPYKSARAKIRKWKKTKGLK